MSTAPSIYYVDDESHNLTVFEASLPSEWNIKVFDSPLKALDALSNDNPWIVVSDQRMPGMLGVNFLEIVKKTHPNAKRVLVTGFTDEDLIVECVRKAQIYDYIRKPWDSEDLSHRIAKMIETYKLENDIREKTSILEIKNIELEKITSDLKISKDREISLRKELESWAPPFVIDMLQKPELHFPIKEDMAVITFDLIDSSRLS